MTFTETFYGYIETTTDTLLIFEACRRGILPKISRRLQEKERSSIRSGTIFVFDERESGIKRWTDGLIWSPSRILGNFLIYRELDGRENIPKRMDVSDRDGFDLTFQKQQPPYSPYASQQPSCEQADRYRERALVGSLTTSYRFKPSGLIKKTMSIVVNGNHLHLISYYNKNDVINNTLPTPSTTASLAHLRISSDMIHRQSFRVSPLLESPLSQIYPINTNDASSRDTQQVKSLPSPSSSPCSTSPNALVNPSSYHPLTKSVHYDTTTTTSAIGQRRRRSSSPNSINLIQSRKFAKIQTDDGSVRSSSSSLSSPHDQLTYGTTQAMSQSEYMIYDSGQPSGQQETKMKTAFLPLTIDSLSTSSSYSNIRNNIPTTEYQPSSHTGQNQYHPFHPQDQTPYASDHYHQQHQQYQHLPLEPQKDHLDHLPLLPPPSTPPTTAISSSNYMSPASDRHVYHPSVRHASMIHPSTPLYSSTYTTTPF